jgi:hypothetical protein
MTCLGSRWMRAMPLRPVPYMPGSHQRAMDRARGLINRYLRTITELP